MDFQLHPQPPLKVPTPPKPTSLKSLVAIFVSAFVIILFILNAPTIVKALAYPFSHSTESDNEKLTQQYRDLYGYDKHPELITSVDKPPMAPSTVATTPSAPAYILPTSAAITGQAQLDATISIPKINVSAPIIQVNNSSDTAILTALKKGVVLYPGSVNPGQPGMAVIIGHSSSDLPWTTYSAVFSLLGKLQPNDLIYVTFSGTKYTYRVRTIQKGSAQQLIDSGLAGDLIVSTCWPIGTDTNRIAVSASLVR